MSAPGVKFSDLTDLRSALRFILLCRVDPQSLTEIFLMDAQPSVNRFYAVEALDHDGDLIRGARHS